MCSNFCLGTTERGASRTTKPPVDRFSLETLNIFDNRDYINEIRFLKHEAKRITQKLLI
jgi:hypothetical protein